MNRRDFVKAGVGASLAVGFDHISAAPKPTPSRLPNVLYVFSDEHRACSLPGEPYNDALAPNITKFARENLSFRNCISNYPVCSPYRAILQTGKWPYHNTVIDNCSAKPPRIGLRSDPESLGNTFRHSGYYTGYIGKWHLSEDDSEFIPPGVRRQGYEDWHVWANTNVHFDKSFTFDQSTGQKIKPRGYNCTLMTDQAVEFIRDRTRGIETKPWMLVVSWNPPHPVYDDAPAEEMRLYDPTALRQRPNVQFSDRFRLTATEAILRWTEQGYYAHITAVDKEFERLLLVLDETGQADNTIVVYTSDHGDLMGSHGYIGKRMPQEESCKVPFIVRYPGVTPHGGESNILFSAIDIYPSLCGLAGIRVPPHCEGSDLSASMRGQKIKGPESVFLMHIEKFHASGGVNNPAVIFRGIRTDRFTYAVADDGRWCLYDNREDPYQQHNLVADPQRTALMHDLDGLVLDWLKKASDPYPYTSLLGKRSVFSA